MMSLTRLKTLMNVYASVGESWVVVGVHEQLSYMPPSHFGIQLHQGAECWLMSSQVDPSTQTLVTTAEILPDSTK